MKIKTLLLLLAVCILPGSLCAGVVFSPDTLGTGKLYRDSTYRRVIKEGTANLDCYFSYPQGGWQIQRGYGGNARELERLDKFMRSSFADTLIYVRRITLTGYCSIEGSYAANEKLAHDRANGFRNYLDTEYGLARRFPVEVRYVGEDWDRLRQLVEASTLPGRAEVLAVIDNTDIFKGREKKLMDLQGGVPYNLMLPLLSVKTNLYTWAGMTPDFDYTAFTPNLSAEFFFARRWSAVASAAYADWDYDSGKCHWGVSAYSLEPRFWVNGDGCYRWCYVGIYGQLGDFDNRSVDSGRIAGGTANCTGTYWEGGLSVGCYILLDAHWGIEAGLRGGYRASDANAYDVEMPYYYFNRNFRENHFGVTGVNISISYRFGSRK